MYFFVAKIAPPSSQEALSYADGGERGPVNRGFPQIGVSGRPVRADGNPARVACLISFLRLDGRETGGIGRPLRRLARSKPTRYIPVLCRQSDGRALRRLGSTRRTRRKRRRCRRPGRVAERKTSSRKPETREKRPRESRKRAKNVFAKTAHDRGTHARTRRNAVARTGSRRRLLAALGRWRLKPPPRRCRGPPASPNAAAGLPTRRRSRRNVLFLTRVAPPFRSRRGRKTISFRDRRRPTFIFFRSVRFATFP